MKNKKLQGIFSFLLVFILTSSIFFSCASSTLVTHGEEYTAGTYLKEYFGAGFKDDDLYLLGDFKNELKKVAPDYNNEGDNVIEAAVIAAGYKELADTYNLEKLKKRETWYYIPKMQNVNERYFYTFLDTGLGNASMVADGKINTKEANAILLNVAEALGTARRYVGFNSDDNIASLLRARYDELMLFTDSELDSVGSRLIKEGKITGYNIKSDAYSARFLSDYTMVYSHDDIEHALQLISLINSENIICRIQLEPKVSVYQYLLEWGPIPEPSLRYKVVTKDNQHLVNALEYDLVLEFSKLIDKERIDAIITKNAKKSSDNPELKGLIKGSWWQPLYTTKHLNKRETYHDIVNNVLHNGDFTINTFTTPENKVDYTRYMRNKDMWNEEIPLLVNGAFYNYLTGTSAE